MKFTPAQQKAIEARGNVLVEAGAGAGKTRTLIQRGLARVLDDDAPVSLDRMLLVTFTEAAAAEMRKRLREELEKEAQAARESSGETKPPESRLAWLEEQLARLELAQISTLHSFCLHLVREHFYELELDPQLSVMDDVEARVRAAETLDEVLRRHYAGDTPQARAVQELILTQGRGNDRPIRELALKLHEYTQTRADPQQWIAEQRAMFASPEPERWRGWLLTGVNQWRRVWLEALASLAADNPKAAECAEILGRVGPDSSRSEIADMLAALLNADGEDNWPKRKKTALRKPLEKLFDEAEFLHSATAIENGIDPLVDDWNWVRPQMQTLIDLAAEFTEAFSRAKREIGMLDFHDLEQFALQLLRDRETEKPRPLAQQWREGIELVFVDEYQDINAAQDQIIRCLSREGKDGNRFLVGDVKQSIYRFRLADPHIFQDYSARWRERDAEGRVITLADNFRSHEAILDFVNGVFRALMRREVGGIEYDAEAELRFGAPEERGELSVATNSTPRVELHLRLRSRDENNAEDAPEQPSAGPDIADLSNVEQEARLVALRLRQLREQGTAGWGDMVVLLRSPANKAESYAKEFARLNVPLEIERGGFFSATEISDLLSLLMLLDNPLQDVPLLAVLRSPLAGLTPDELARVRLTVREGGYWTALNRWHEEQRQKIKAGGSTGATNTTTDHGQWTTDGLDGSSTDAKNATEVRPETFSKVAAFLARFGRWRELARQGALSRCLETVLDETHYEDWLRAQERGEHRCANVRRLLQMTRLFDPHQRQGLYRFLTYIEAQEKAAVDIEPASAESGDAVRLMSIHKSKGLEFPVVVLAELGAKFNFADLKDGIILDETFGLCPHVRPPETEQVYPSLPFWLARTHQRQEQLGEELRLLYVAMTRACRKLILTGTASRSSAESRWTGEAGERLTVHQLLAANKPLDWLGPLIPALTGTTNWIEQAVGQSSMLSWRVYETEDLAAPEGQVREREPYEPELELPDGLLERLAWNYPHAAATIEPAKTSVTALRRRVMDETDDEARPVFYTPSVRRAQKSELSAPETGIAHHKFLQHVALERADSLNELTAEADRMAAEKILTPEERAGLDLEAVAAFWNSELGGTIRARAKDVKRELPFTARFAPGQLMARAGAGAEQDAGRMPDDEFVVLQGVADLVVMLENEIWLVDFKTDRVTKAQLAERVKMYSSQLSIYADALSRIYGRPVTQRWLHFLDAQKSVAV